MIEAAARDARLVAITGEADLMTSVRESGLVIITRAIEAETGRAGKIDDDSIIGSGANIICSDTGSVEEVESIPIVTDIRCRTELPYYIGDPAQWD